MSDYSFSTFPKNEYEALALLYTQNQDLKGKSIQQIAEIYYSALYEFKYSTTEIDKFISDKFKNR